VGLIDDAALAEHWVTSRQRTKGSTRSVLKHELRQKGVSDENAEAALALITEADEYERARSLIATKIRATERLTPKARTRRLMGLLMRRGYSANLAQVVVQEALGDCE
jgi:regulatory protein